MNADSKNVNSPIAAQLATFDDWLHATVDDVDMLADIQEGIGRLLSTSGSNEAQVRQVLQQRYDDGALRKETFQLVKSMLDRYVSETIPTSPAAHVTSPAPQAARSTTLPISEEPAADDIFGTTAVLPTGLVNDKRSRSSVRLGSVLRDRYLLQEEIPGGSMGVVYKAMDRRLAEAGSDDYWVAVKVLSPQLAENGEALRALQQEAAKGRCLTHPNIVRFIDLDRDDDLHFLILEWLDGRSLAEILDSKDTSEIDSDAAFRIVRQIGEALDYAHRCGIVHADVKPGNIMIMPNGDAKLFDFGVARVKQQHIDTEFDPGVLGALTPAYSSMQVLTGEEPVAADDVFSLSCLLYRLLAGYRVFGPRNAAEASQEGMDPQRLTVLNDSQWRVLKKGLAYSRVTRFASMREFVDALEGSSDETFVVEVPDPFAAEQQVSGIGKYVIALVAVLALAATFAYRSGFLDSSPGYSAATEISAPNPTENDTPIARAPEAHVTETQAVLLAESAVMPEADGSNAVFLDVAKVRRQELAGPDPMLVDFSKLPAATVVIPFSPGVLAEETFKVVLREDSGAVIVDFVRDRELATSMTLRLDEVGFSGNRSPWAAGQFTLSNSGLIQFPAGQARGRVTMTMASDPRREADQQSTLRLRQLDFAGFELATVTVVLEDDDQRVFESGLPQDTVAFAAGQVSIRETDPAVQIDLVRFNPGDSLLVVGFSVEDITATEGADYFAPNDRTVTFGPGQRSARLLVPLVQDNDVEGDEAFVIELTGEAEWSATDVFRRSVVMIRDDEPQDR